MFQYKHQKWNLDSYTFLAERKRERRREDQRERGRQREIRVDLS